MLSRGVIHDSSNGGLVIGFKAAAEGVGEEFSREGAAGDGFS